MNVNLNPGDQVTVRIKDREILTQMQKPYGGWEQDMDECIENSCTVVSVACDKVMLKGPSGNSYNIDINLISKYNPLKAGDNAVFIDDLATAQKLQSEDNSFTNEIKDLLGSVVTIVSILSNESVTISYQDQKYKINPKCLKFIVRQFYKLKKDEKEVKELQNDHGGWSDLLKFVLDKEVEIVKIMSKFDCYVKYCGMEWRINMSCLLSKSLDENSKERLCQNLKKGDRVKIIDNEEAVRQLQDKHGGWNSRMKKVLGAKGTITLVVPSGDVRVKFGSFIQYMFNPACCELLEQNGDGNQFKEGDIIEVIKDKEKVKSLQPGHGEWVPGMEIFCGKQGKVLFLYPDGDLRVKIMKQKLTFNPLCCVKIGEGDSDSSLDMFEIIPKMAKLFSALSNSDSDDSDNDNETSKLSDNKLLPKDARDLINDLQEGKMDAIKSKINKNNVNRKITHESPTHIAASSGHSNVLQFLVTTGADINQINGNGDTPLHLSVIKKHTDCVKICLNNERCDVNKMNFKKLSPLMIAAAYGPLDMFQEIMNCRWIDINLRSPKFGSALHLAIKKSEVNKARLLLNHDCDMTITTSNGFLALHFCALRGNKEILSLIIEKHPSIIDDQKEDGFGAIHICAVNDHMECMDILVKAGANLNLQNIKQQTALHVAVSQQHLEFMEKLLEYKADPNLQDIEGETPLHDAIQLHCKQRNFLLEFMSDVREGNTKYEDIAISLIKHGASLSIKNNENLTPLDVCIDTQLKKKLQRIQAEVNNMSIPATSAIEGTVTLPEEIVEELQKRADRNVCRICFARATDITFLCGHQCCENCANNMNQCHICRKEIIQKIRMLN